MIKDGKTLSGLDPFSLPFSSKERLVKICDKCGNEGETSLNTVLRTRKKHNTDKDYCWPCSIQIYNRGENNSAKRPEVKKKMSQAMKGKSKTFKDGVNLRRLPKKLNTAGYALVWSEEHNKHVHEHRFVYAQHHKRNIEDLKEIHHLDGDKLNNEVSNLIELGQSEHSTLHSQLETLAFCLVKKGLIYFDKTQNRYLLNPMLDLQTSPISYGFEDVAIKQAKNICKSRLDVDISSEIIRGVKVKIPMIAANMSTVVNADFYTHLHRFGAFAILHRADSKENIIKTVETVSKTCEWVAASIGVEADQFDFAKELIQQGSNILVIDIAHGYSDVVLDLAKKLKKFSPGTKLVIGNTNNVELLYESYEFVDAIKVGIAQGFACETKNTAGCTEKQFSAVLQFKKASREFGIPVISDGGIREPADFVKSIAAGANSIMAGKIFAACPESAAETRTMYKENGDILSQDKIYAGMASRYVQEKWKGGLKPGTCPEGGVRYLPVGESAEKLLERYAGALKSGITYAGANNIVDFQNNVKFVILK